MSCYCFWDRYWGRDGQLLANFFPAIETVPEVLAYLTRPSSLLTFTQVSGQLSYCSPSILIRAFKNVGVVKMLQCFRTQVDTDLLQQINLYQDNRKHGHYEVK